MRDHIKIIDLNSIQYSFKGRDWSFSVGQYLKSIDSKILRIYLDQEYEASSGVERYVIEVIRESTETIHPWRIIRFSDSDNVFVVELEI